jgi:hypothetical protein
MQLVSRIPGAEPDHDAILTQVRIFKESVNKCLDKFSKKGSIERLKPEEISVPKLFEEIKVMFQDIQNLPARIEQTVIERPLRSRRYQPIMLMEMEHYLDREHGDPSSLLVISSLFKDRVPWLYEMGMETYRAIRSGDAKKAEDSLRDFQKMLEMTMHGPFMEELDSPKEIIMMREILERFIRYFKTRNRLIKPNKEQSR